MNILLSNDDGVNAPGIHALYKTLSKKHHVTMVAPLQERSTTGHTLSLDSPLRLQKISDTIYGCSGFPSDCIFMALGHICRDKRPDLVITGINRGANLGQDLFYSGTVAAAREAAFHGLPAIAMSLVLESPHRDHEYYETAADYVDQFVSAKAYEGLPPMSLININVPNVEKKHIKGVEWTLSGLRNYSEDVVERMDSRNLEYYWVAGLYQGHREIGQTDCEAVADFKISVNAQQLIQAIPCDFERIHEQVLDLPYPGKLS